MSHIVTVQTRLKDPAAITAACKRLGFVEPYQGTAHFYSREVTGLLVHLPDWQYPLVIDPSTGAVQYDNYGGEWGDFAQLHKFLQTYAVEKVKLEARKKGRAVSEQALEDGSVRLQIVEGA
jgi:hypothetical protein